MNRESGPERVGFEGLSAGDKVVVAMSGGVDSSAVAARARAAGFEVIGITLQLYDHGKAVNRKGACCAGEDIHDARRVADHLGLAHYVFDFEERFKRSVIEDFAASYAKGETPIPCVRCNQRVKFADLLDIARDLGAQALLTGHYARRVVGPQGAELHMGSDPGRDQSYFLFATRQEELEFLRFPLGHLTKDVVRREAAAAGLTVADKADSQDICFVPEGRYAALVEKLHPEAATPGEIVDIGGTVLGEHSGLLNFTVGQRRGLGLSGASEPLFVVALDAPTRRVIVGPREALRSTALSLREVNLLAGVDFERRVQAQAQAVCVKIRSTRPAIPAWLQMQGEDAQVEIPAGEEAVAPGQACVFYAPEGGRVLGGGFIARPGKNKSRLDLQGARRVNHGSLLAE